MSDHPGLIVAREAARARLTLDAATLRSLLALVGELEAEAAERMGLVGRVVDDDALEAVIRETVVGLVAFAERRPPRPGASEA